MSITICAHIHMSTHISHTHTYTQVYTCTHMPALRAARGAAAEGLGTVPSMAAES